jgi:hypothetical protein
MKIESLFKILFITIKISEASFVRFFEDHLQRLISNNPGGKYTPLITSLTTSLTGFKASIDQRNLHQALQESRTMTVDQLIAEFKTLISRMHTTITDIWDVNHATYQEFFPRGLDEYTKATKGNIVSLMTRFVAACDLHREDLPAGFATPVNTLKANYETSRTTQLGMIGSTDGNRVDVVQKREAVALQITKNVHTLAIDYAGHPEMVAVYFDQSIITRQSRPNGEPPEPDIYTDAVAPLAKVVILHGGFDINTAFHVVNTGSVNLKFYTANMPDDAVPGNALELAPGEEDDVTGSELGAEGNLFLMAHNTHATIAGSYEVSIEIE